MGLFRIIASCSLYALLKKYNFWIKRWGRKLEKILQLQFSYWCGIWLWHGIYDKKYFCLSEKMLLFLLLILYEVIQLVHVGQYILVYFKFSCVVGENGDLLWNWSILFTYVLNSLCLNFWESPCSETWKTVLNFFLVVLNETQK